jgi:hypothetical protein
MYVILFVAVWLNLSRVLSSAEPRRGFDAIAVVYPPFEPHLSVGVCAVATSIGVLLFLFLFTRGRAR